MIWRRAGTPDVVLATWQHHFDPVPGNFDAIPYEMTAESTVAVDFDPGDLLVFRYTGQSATLSMAYVPNGDGARQNGRIPYLELPQ